MTYPIYEQIKQNGVTNFEVENKSLFNVNKFETVNDHYGEISLADSEDKLDKTQEVRQASPVVN